MPASVSEIELTRGIFDVAARAGCTEHRFLVRHEGDPLGWLRIPLRGDKLIPATKICDALVEQLGGRITEHVFSRKLRLAPRPEKGKDGEEVLPRPISVVVCTRDRTSLLKRCLNSLMHMDYPSFEVIVVDNAPSGNETARLVAALSARWTSRGEGLRLRYVREDAPGLDRARNRGIAEAEHDIVAFTDDDTHVDRWWLRAINRAFHDREVDAVTGFVAPLELYSPAQVYFEDVYGGMGKGFQSRKTRAAALGMREQLWASAFGVGANMAFRKAIFSRVGPFDERLDVGTPSRGGGDVDMFHRIVAHDRVLRYEPAALVWHRHRRSRAALREQLFDNGCSFGVYLLTRFFSPLASRRAVIRFAFRNWIGGWFVRRIVRPGKHDRHMILPEMAGVLWSPVAFLMSRRDLS